MADDLIPAEPLLPKRKAGAQPGNKHASRLNPKVKAVAALLMTEPDITVEAACERVQCPRSTFYQAERSDAYQAYLNSLSATKIRTRLLVRAMHRYERLQDATSEYVAEAANKTILRETGVFRGDDRGQGHAGLGSITIVFGSRPDARTPNGAPGVQIELDAEKIDDASGT